MAPEDAKDKEPSGETIARGAFQPKSGADQTGDLATVQLEEILTNIFCARSTGTLTIDAVDKEPAGELVVWKGDVLAASAGKTSGEEAVFALLGRRSGTFRFTEELEPRDQNVKRSVPELVAEAARRRGDKRPGPR
jgi:hypothetical protein